MIRLVDGMTLYHGSYCEITDPDLAKCAPYKDFGSGFYVTSSYQQAKKFIKTSLKKAKSQGLVDNGQKYGFITEFRYLIDENLRVKIYEDADSEWLHCVVAHRKSRTFPTIVENIREYDIIAGKIADDATNFTILAYIAGAYGNIGSDEVDKLCISRLLPERLDDQYCFRTKQSLACLKCIGSEVIVCKD